MVEKGSLWQPAVVEVQELFGEEIAAAGGSVTDGIADGDRLFIRATLPQAGEAGPGDEIRGGVALRIRDQEILVHPYTLRLVCRNGAIFPMVTGTRVVHRAGPDQEGPGADRVLEDVREAVRASCRPEVFARSLEEMVAARGIEAPSQSILLYLTMIRRLPSLSSGGLRSEIVSRLLGAGDRTPFTLANVITALARDQADPAVRWDLEELGGGAFALLRPGRNRGLPGLAGAASDASLLAGSGLHQDSLIGSRS